MRAGYETTVESRILLSYFSPQKLETVYACILNFNWNFRFTLLIVSTKLIKDPRIKDFK